MALEALSSSDLLNFIIYDNNNYNNNNNITHSATPFSNTSNDHQYSSEMGFFLPQQQVSNSGGGGGGGGGGAAMDGSSSLGVVRKKRKRKAKVCKNKEEAETQRMTHIAVERNRRKQMNEHLAVLKSLMPKSYVQRGDQASIVGGAIEYAKTLENMLQSLEIKKFQTLQQGANRNDNTTITTAATSPTTTTTTFTTTTTTVTTATQNLLPTPFAQFFTYPQYTCPQFPNNFTSSKSNPSIANIEVTLIETHANVKILCRKRVRQLSKMVSGFQTLYLNILHLNVTTLDPLVLYSISAKVEEGCQFNSADDIANAVHHILLIIEDEALISML